MAYRIPSKKNKEKIVIVDFDDIHSIKNAERKKAVLENAGLNLRGTKQMSFSKYKLIYE
jgi:hypothetical protein